MAKKTKPTAESLGRVLAELTSFVEGFDVHDPEDAQIRTGVLISNLFEAGLLKSKRSLPRFRLNLAIEDLSGIRIEDRAHLVEQAEIFRDLISSYGDEPTAEDMETAREILATIAEKLEQAITKAMRKGESA